MARHTSTKYWVERLEDGKAITLVHTVSGKKKYHEFIDRAKAKALMDAELAITPKVPHRIVKHTVIWEIPSWPKS